MNAAYLLSLLPFLACPLGMGLMMWLMRRANADQTGDAARPQAGAGAPEDRLAVLRAQLSNVEAQQAALAGQLATVGEGDGAARALPASATATAPR